MSDSSPSPASLPLIPCDVLMSALYSPSRWKILKALCEGEPLGAGELAPIAGCKPSAASKHMRVLVEAGICVQGRGRLYRIAPRFQPAPGAPRVLDFGHCLIRLDLEATN